jgi:hypothetical protein
MSRWRRQQRKRARRRREEDRAVKVFGDYIAEWSIGFDRAVKSFGEGMIRAAGAIAKWGAERRMRAALERSEAEDECL